MPSRPNLNGKEHFSLLGNVFESLNGRTLLGSYGVSTKTWGEHLSLLKDRDIVHRYMQLTGYCAKQVQSQWLENERTLLHNCAKQVKSQWLEV